jgi:hypothetical protein
MYYAAQGLRHNLRRIVAKIAGCVSKPVVQWSKGAVEACVPLVVEARYP